MNADITSIPLTFAEEAELALLEDQIESGMRTFMQVGLALVTINDNKLYRATHSTFIEYAKDRFGLTGSYAYRVMAGAKVVTELPSPISDIITVESQARELVGLPTEDAARVLIAAIDSGSPTAESIRAARERMVPAGTLPDRARKRPPLSKDIRVAIQGLGTAMRRVERVFTDDRWARNRDQVWPHDLDEIRAFHELLGRVIADLDVG